MEFHLDGGFVLDDDRGRVDRVAVHAFLTTSHWAGGRDRDLIDELRQRGFRATG